MAINLASKYSARVAKAFSLRSFLNGRTSGAYQFDGVRSVKVFTPITVDEVDYERSGTSRYGMPQDMQDTVQELMLTQDKSFSLIIDKGDNTSQMMVKNASDMLLLQLQEKTVPNADRYAFSQFVRQAGTVKGISQKPTKATVAEIILDACQAMDDLGVPDGAARTLFATAQMCKLIKLSPEFIGIDRLGEKALSKGQIGEISGMQVVKVPTSYLPQDCYFLITYKESILFPYKLKDTKIHTDPPGISGALIEGRHYYDAFVLGAKANGVYAVVLADKKLPEPAITVTGSSASIACSGAQEIRYTLDGTDPRYSSTAKVYSAAVNVPQGACVRAVGYDGDQFTSDVALKNA